MSKKACLGILRRSKARDKELPKQLKIALEIQGGIREVDQGVIEDMTSEYKAYHINQRSEGIDLNGISGALMATQNMQMQTFVTESMLCLNDQGGNRMDITKNITGTLRASMGGNLPIVMAKGQDNVELFDNHGRDCRYNGPLEVAPTIAATYGTGGNNVPLVSKPIDKESYCIVGNIIDRKDHNGGNGCGFQENISYTLTTGDVHAVCFPPRTYQDIVGALCVGDEKGIGNQYVSQNKCIVDCKNLVRRLTPLECERLQGFPDGWTNIEKSSDSGRYKALGNSVAIPCVNFIMRGIAYFLKRFKEEGDE